MIKLGKQSSNFFIEKVYIDSFVHEDINKLEVFQIVSHIDYAVNSFLCGLDSNINNFFKHRLLGSRSASTTSN